MEEGHRKQLKKNQHVAGKFPDLVFSLKDRKARPENFKGRDFEGWHFYVYS